MRRAIAPRSTSQATAKGVPVNNRWRRGKRGCFIRKRTVCITGHIFCDGATRASGDKRRDEEAGAMWL